ncbi:MAG: glycosyltransferase [Acidobacteriota bacterium]
MPRRVLFLEVLTTIAGGQRALLELMPLLSRRFEAIAVLPGEGPLAEALRSSGVQLNFLTMRPFTLVEKNWHDILNFILDTPRLILELSRLARRQSINLVYINSSRALVWGTLGAWLSGLPVIWHAHNVLEDNKTRALVGLLASLPTVRKIVCPSNSAAAQFARHRAKVVIVPYGIDLERFAPSKDMRAQARRELDIPPTAPVVGIIGDLIPLKGQDVFVQAAIQVAQHLRDAVFLIIGGARPNDASRHFLATLESAIRNAPCDIRLLGARSNIAELVNGLDVAVVASTTETGPLVLLQALACGVPVVSTPVGMAVQLLEDGECGSIFPTNDSRALAERLVQVLGQTEMRARMSRAARQRSIEQIGLRGFQTRVAEIIEHAIG